MNKKFILPIIGTLLLTLTSCGGIENNLYPFEEKDDPGEVIHEHEFDFDASRLEWNLKASIPHASLVVPCKTCNFSLQLEATVNTKGEYTAPTCTLDGSGSFVATVSYKGVSFTNEQNDVVIPKYGHDMHYIFNETNHTYQCSRCDYHLDPEVHDLDPNGQVTKEPTCAEKGVRSFACHHCDVVITQDIDMVEHTYGSIHDSIRTIGRKEKTCTVCGHIENVSEVMENVDFSTSYFGLDENDSILFGQSTKVDESKGVWIYGKNCEYTVANAIVMPRIDYTQYLRVKYSWKQRVNGNCISLQENGNYTGWHLDPKDATCISGTITIAINNDGNAIDIEIFQNEYEGLKGTVPAGVTSKITITNNDVLTGETGFTLYMKNWHDGQNSYMDFSAPTVVKPCDQHHWVEYESMEFIGHKLKKCEVCEKVDKGEEIITNPDFTKSLYNTKTMFGGTYNASSLNWKDSDKETNPIVAASNSIEYNFAVPGYYSTFLPRIEFGAYSSVKFDIALSTEATSGSKNYFGLDSALAAEMTELGAKVWDGVTGNAEITKVEGVYKITLTVKSLTIEKELTQNQINGDESLPIYWHTRMKNYVSTVTYSNFGFTL